MKNFVIKYGDLIINFMCWVCILISIIGGLCTGFYAIIFIPVGMLLTISIFYLLYMLMDIKDALHKIEENTRKN